MAEQTTTPDWTCTRCEMTVSWMADVEQPELPATWVEEEGELYCLACQRDMAGEAALAAAPEDGTQSERNQIESRARVEFELRRKPDRPDSRIASACGSSVDAVRKARARLGLQSRTPG